MGGEASMRRNKAFLMRSLLDRCRLAPYIVGVDWLVQVVDAISIISRAM